MAEKERVGRVQDQREGAAAAGAAAAAARVNGLDYDLHQQENEPTSQYGA